MYKGCLILILLCDCIDPKLLFENIFQLKFLLCFERDRLDFIMCKVKKISKKKISFNIDISINRKCKYVSDFYENNRNCRKLKK